MEIILVFIIGLAIGSFLNVLIDRLPRGESILKGRSRCDSCKKEISWFDLIPVFSFFILRRKCRHCHKRISPYYPIVEFTSGVLFVLIYMYLGGNSQYQISNIKYQIELIYYLFLASSLIVIFFTDLKYGIIPDRILFPAILISLAYIILNTQYLPADALPEAAASLQAGMHQALQTGLILSNLLSAIGAFLFFLLLYIITRKKGMGFGDVKLAFLMGIFLGFPEVIVALYMAFLTGAVVSLILVLWGKKNFFGGTIPFGPFLVLGALISLFFGNQILQKIIPLLP